MREFLTLFKEIGNLKDTDRQGWKRVGVANPESVADHSYRCAVIGWVLGEELDLDTKKLIKLLLIHDVPEAKIGDLTPYDVPCKEEKTDLEKRALVELLEESGVKEKEDIVSLWKEFESGESKEAEIARDIDKFEMILQAVEYKEKKEHAEKDFSEFITMGKKEIETPEVERLLHWLI
ncbi:MAG: HD domain-containing protein [Candidatus Natronoplasma sp.]